MAQNGSTPIRATGSFGVWWRTSFTRLCSPIVHGFMAEPPRATSRPYREYAIHPPS